MNGMRLNRSGLNVSRLNASLLNASGIGAMGCKGKVTMEDRIMESMVLWYDLAKQGATNEGMAADPRIIDHSGNGHHADCYNFAWSGMSGIGGYAYEFSFFVQYDANRLGLILSYDRGSYVFESPQKMKILRCVSSQNYANPLIEVNVGTEPQDVNIGPFSIKVTNNIYDDLYIYFSPTKTIIPLKEGINNIPNLYGANCTNMVLGIFRDNPQIEDCDITLEMLPEYPNALVSDGVDDYAQVTGLPILTKERGYTVVAKRKMLDNIARNALVSKCTRWLSEAEVGVNGAFNIQANGMRSIYNFGRRNIDVNVEQDVIYQTSKSFNGETIQVGDLEDSEQMSFFSINSGASWHTKCTLYSFLLFDRDLTDEEIEWVRTNLMSE